MKTKKFKNAILAMTMVMVLLISSIAAYLTDSETIVNEFKIGHISIDLLEPSWNPESALAVKP